MGHLACKETLHFFFFYYPLDCMTPLGMENLQIPDSSITASSEVSVIDSKTTERLRFEIKKKNEKPHGVSLIQVLLNEFKSELTCNF